MFRGQFDALALHVTFWWQFVLHSLADGGCDPAMRDWLTCRLLPVVYWHEQMQKTKTGDSGKSTGVPGSRPWPH